MTMRAGWWLPVGLLFLVISACARSDWIDSTLVTVDVGGRWTGSYGSLAGPTARGEIVMSLSQAGPKATGDIRLIGANGQLWSGRIDGTVSGDAFKFSRPDGRLRGEMSVAGDEMSGTITFGSGTRELRLQRQP